MAHGPELVADKVYEHPIFCNFPSFSEWILTFPPKAMLKPPVGALETSLSLPLYHRFWLHTS